MAVHERTLGLGSSTALVVGSIIGTGVFTMPAVTAGAATSSIVVLAAVSVGAVLLGVTFGQLTHRIPPPTVDSTPTLATSSATSRAT